MRCWLIGAILVGSAVASILSVILVFRMTSPPDAMAAVLGGLWIAMPFLAAAGLTALTYRHIAPLVTLLIALLISAAIGLSIYNASATQQEAAQQRVRDAVQPGEAPDSGPAGMRKAGADAGASIGWVFSILLAVVLPPVQLATLVIPTLVAYGVSALLGAREARQVPEHV